MSKYLYIHLILGFGIFHQASSQDIPRLDPDEIRQAKITSEKLYEGETLNGYLSEGSELYMAYGFERLSMQEVVSDGERFTVLVYQMADPASAFGIYSMLRIKCDTIPRLTRSECASALVYQAERNRYYYSVINQSGSKKAMLESLNLARALAGKIHPDSIPWPDIFNYDLFIEYQNSLKFVKGKIALEKLLPAWSSYFESEENYKAWYMPVKTANSGSYALAIISFETPSDRKHFIKNSSLALQKIGNLKPENTRLGWKIGESELLFVDAREFRDSLSPYVSAFYQYIKKYTNRK